MSVFWFMKKKESNELTNCFTVELIATQMQVNPSHCWWKSKQIDKINLNDYLLLKKQSKEFSNCFTVKSQVGISIKTK